MIFLSRKDVEDIFYYLEIDGYGKYFLKPYIYIVSFFQTQTVYKIFLQTFAKKSLAGKRSTVNPARVSNILHGYGQYITDEDKLHINVQNIASKFLDKRIRRNINLQRNLQGGPRCECLYFDKTSV